MSAADAYCNQCGSLQPEATPRTGNPSYASGAKKDFTDSIDSRTWNTLCYLPGLGWLASVFVLAAERFQSDRNSRFHAFQGLYLFVAWLIIDWGVAPFFLHGRGAFNVKSLLHLALVATGIFMMVKTHQRQNFRLPVFGELADRSLADHP
ncbi:MAG: hypothetical protein ABI972_02870 [Acidobacteriota bacterium]